MKHMPLKQGTSHENHLNLYLALLNSDQECNPELGMYSPSLAGFEQCDIFHSQSLGDLPVV